MTAAGRLMDLIVRYHELPKGEIVTKRDEIARELHQEIGLHPNDHILVGNMPMWIEKLWNALIDTRTRLAEREEEIQQLRRFIEPAPRKDPR